MRYTVLFLFIFIQAIPVFSQKISNSVELIAESDKKTLSQVVDLDINFSDEQFQIFIADVFISSVLVGKRKGQKITLEKGYGREGLGPGEFIEVTNVQLHPENGLLVYDGNLAMISLFEVETQKVEQTVKLDTRGRIHFPMEVLSLTEGNDGSKLFYTKSEMFISDNSSESQERSVVIQVFNEDGKLVSDSLIVKPANDVFVYKKGGNVSVNPIPIWGRKSIIRINNDRIYSIWSGEPKIRIYDLKGLNVDSLNLELEQLEITENDKSEALKFEAMMMDIKKSRIREQLFLAMREDYWPWVHDFLIDDLERVWIGLPSHFGAESRTWRVYNLNGSLFKELEFPLDFTIHKVKDNYVVGEYFNFKKFTSTVRIYKVDL